MHEQNVLTERVPCELSILLLNVYRRREYFE